MMVRASGTERLLGVYSETSRPEATKRVLEEVAAIVDRLYWCGNESIQCAGKVFPISGMLETEDQRRTERELRQSRQAQGRIHLASSRPGGRALSGRKRRVAHEIPRSRSSRA